METIRNSPKIADPLGIMDCSGVSDGAAAAIVVRAEDAHKYCKNPIFIKALSFVAGPAEGPLSQEYDFTTSPKSSPPRATPTRRPVSPIRANRSAWPKFTTASRRPNWC